MSVRDFDDQRRFVMEPDFIDDLRKFSAEFLGKENDPNFFVRNCIFQRFLQFTSFMDNNALHTCQTHSGVGIDVIADKIHFHRNRLLDQSLPRIIKEMISP